PGEGPASLSSVATGGHAHELGEASGEGTEGPVADREAHLGDAEVAAAQQRHGALDAPGHEVAVRRFPVRRLELAAEVAGGEADARGERLDIERARVLAVDPIPYTPEQHEVAQPLVVVALPSHQAHLAV